MNRAECERLIADYLRWLKEGLQVSELQGSCRIATPFVDRHNDEIEIYVEKHNGKLLLTDDGYTIADLASSGMTFSTDRRRAHLTAILNGFGVHQQDDELQVHATPQDFPQKKHNLVQAMLAVNDMFVMGEEHVLSLFKEDVAKFLEANQIPVFPDFKLSGRSGFDHKFDFGLPKTQRRPQRVIRAINDLTKDQSLSFAFAVADVRVLRADPLIAFTFVNDVEHPPNEDNLAAIKAYEIEPLMWSKRQDVLSLLNGH
ncbi:MAG TPA: DUF1828 domain-containing protein [Verrucomicrobiae bacterium]